MAQFGVLELEISWNLGGLIGPEEMKLFMKKNLPQQLQVLWLYYTNKSAPKNEWFFVVGRKH